MSEALLSTPTSGACKENPLGRGHNNSTASCSSAYSVSPSPPLASCHIGSLHQELVQRHVLWQQTTVHTTAQMKEGQRTSNVNSSYEAFGCEENFQRPGNGWLVTIFSTRDDFSTDCQVLSSGLAQWAKEQTQQDFKPGVIIFLLHFSSSRPSSSTVAWNSLNKQLWYQNLIPPHQVDWTDGPEASSGVLW